MEHIVLIADHPHGDRAAKELRNLGHEVTYVQDLHGAAYSAIHPGTSLVIAMNLHSAFDRVQEKARTCGARFLFSPIGWSKLATKLAQEGIQILPPALALVEPDPAALNEGAGAPRMVPDITPRCFAGPGLFMFEAHAVRVAGSAEDPRFVVADVCEVLEISNHRDAVSALDPDEKGVASIDTPGGPQEMLTVTEPGLYALLARSRKPAAKRFDRWVRHEVLPTIRRTGSYVAAPPESEDALVLRAFGVLQGRVKALQAENTALVTTNKAQAHAIEEAAPAVDFYMRYANADGLTGLRDAGRMFTGHPDKWIDSLKGKFLFYSDGTLVPYSEYGAGGRGLFVVKQRTIPTGDGGERLERRTWITAKGMQFFARLVTEAA